MSSCAFRPSSPLLPACPATYPKRLLSASAFSSPSPLALPEPAFPERRRALRLAALVGSRVGRGRLCGNRLRRRCLVGLTQSATIDSAGSAAWDGDVKQKSATGLKSHSAAHVLPRPTCGMLPAVENRPTFWLCHWVPASVRCQAPKREHDDVSTCLADWLAARHDRTAGGRPVNHTYRP